MLKKLNINLTILVLIVQLNVNCFADYNKYVIGTDKTWGFFAAFFCVLDHLVLCEQNKKIPVIYWSKDSPYYKEGGYNNSLNVWEYYFEPVSNLKYIYSDKIHRTFLAPHPCKEIATLSHKIYKKIDNYKDERLQIKRVIDKYIKIKPRIKNKINKFYKNKMEGKKTIGIHLRGTDKNSEFQHFSDFKHFTVENILKEANKFSDYQYFIATDEQALLDLAKKNLKNKVIFHDSYRSLNKLPVHYFNNNSSKIGEDVLIEVILLSMCDKMIHGTSNVSMAALCFNPNLESINL